MSAQHPHNISSATANQNEEGDINLVSDWVKLDVVRWMAGFGGGVFSGVVMLVFAMVLSATSGGDLWLPTKMLALPILGASALEYGLGASVIVGTIATLLLCGFLGIVFAHFTRTNRFLPLVSVGATWGIFSWIFLNNLFFKSWRDYYAAGTSDGAAFFVCLVFGMSLVSVAFFDRMVRGREL